MFKDREGTGHSLARAGRLQAEKSVEAKLGEGLQCILGGLGFTPRFYEPCQRRSDKSELGLERWLDLQSRWHRTGDSRQAGGNGSPVFTHQLPCSPCALELSSWQRHSQVLIPRDPPHTPSYSG